MANIRGRDLIPNCAIKIDFCVAVAAILVIASITTAQAQTGVALVIGNSAYLHTSRLANPARDARLMAKTLRVAEFEVLEYTDVGYRTMRRAFAAFTSKLQAHGRDSVGLVFYAGHGLQLNGANYMVPIDANIAKEADIEIEGVSASSLMRSISIIGNKLNIIILDACRNNPYRSMFRSTSRGLARMDAPIGSLVAFSTAPGMVAADGTGKNSPYTENLARAMAVPGLKIEDMFKRVRNEVFEATNGNQVSWESSSIFHDFYFSPPSSTVTALPSGQPGQVWSIIQTSESIAVLEAFVAKFPASSYAGIAKTRLEELRKSSANSDVTLNQSLPLDKAARKSRPRDNRFRAVMVENGNLISSDLRWDVYAAEADGDGKRTHVTYSTDASPEFKLQDGHYFVTVKYGNAIATENVQVRSDQPWGQRFVLNAGQLQPTASLATGSADLQQNIRWDIYHAEKDEDGKRKHITYSTDWRPKFTLPSGKYYLTAVHGSAHAGVEILIEPGKNRKQALVLNAGRLVLTAALFEAGKPLKSNLRWDVYHAALDEDDNRKHITYSTDWRPKFILPADQYFVVATNGNARVGRELKIVAGQLSKQKFVLDAGRLIVDAILTEGKNPLKSDVRFDIYGSDLDEDGRRNHVTYSTAARSKFVLPAGSYLIWASYGNARRSIKLAIKSGVVTQKSIDLNAGRVILEAILTEGKAPLKSDVRFDVYSSELDEDGNRQHITYSTDWRSKFALPKGAYIVWATHDSARRSVKIDVKPGHVVNQSIDLSAGRIKLIGRSKDGTQLTKGLRWDIYSEDIDFEGRRKAITYSTSAVPIFTLNAGAYHLYLTQGNARFEQKIVVSPGDQKAMEVTLK